MFQIPGENPQLSVDVLSSARSLLECMYGRVIGVFPF
jgi:hypothetical protein